VKVNARVEGAMGKENVVSQGIPIPSKQGRFFTGMEHRTDLEGQEISPGAKEK